MKINREKLLHALESVQPGLAQKEISGQENCFAFTKGKVQTFNDELSCSAPTGLNGEVSGAVPGGPLLEQLRRWTEDAVDLRQSDGKLTMLGKRRRATFRMESDVTLPVKLVERPEEWTKLPPSFGEALDMVRGCAADSSGQTTEVNFVHLHPKWVEAWDTVQLCRWRVRTGIKEAALVRKEAARHVASLGMEEVSETKGWIHFRNAEGLVLSCRRYVESFTDLGQFMTVEGEVLKLPKGLESAIDKAKVFSEENPTKMIRVTVAGGEMRVHGEGLSGGFEEKRKVEWAGEDLEFLVSPAILAEVAKRYPECRVSKDRIKAEGERFRYVTVLTLPDERSEEVEEGEQEEEAE